MTPGEPGVIPTSRQVNGTSCIDSVTLAPAPVQHLMTFNRFHIRSYREPMCFFILCISLLSLLAISAGSHAHEGRASYYASKFQGRKTASGEHYDADALTAAHRSLPFGTQIRVINLHNDRSVIVRINDRGPYVKGRIIDLSRRAARQLGMLDAGTAHIRIEYLE